MKKTGLLLGCVLLLAGCIGKKTRPAVTPSISYISLTPDSIRGGNSEDTAYITFKVVDGDGDLGVNQATPGLWDIYIKSSRGIDTGLNDFFSDIPAGANDPDVGISTTVQKVIPAFQLVPRDTSATDSVVFELYVQDKAGHESNHIFTDKLYIKPH